MKSNNSVPGDGALLAAALQHPLAVSKLLNSLNGNRQPHGIKPGIPSTLRDPNLRDGIAHTHAVSVVKVNPNTFKPFDIDYPIELLAKRLLREEKKHRSGSAPFELQAWKNFHTLPPFCKDFIQEFLNNGSEKKSKSRWTLLVADPLYENVPGRFMQMLHKKPLKLDNVKSVLLVFKCNFETKSRQYVGRDEIIDSLAEKVGELSKNASEITKYVAKQYKRRSDERRGVRSSSRSRRRRSYSTESSSGDDSDSARKRSRFRSRSRPQYSYAGAAPYEGDVTYGSRVTEVEAEEPGIDEDLPDEELSKLIMTRYTGYSAG